ncbi:MAG: hypothetical protein SFV15_25765 [Polyangiaceae bacterium]|nr:hypothetical protein [Polyangiaceae bacterium]
MKPQNPNVIAADSLPGQRGGRRYAYLGELVKVGCDDCSFEVDARTARAPER